MKMDDPILTRADIMERLDCSRETIRQWIKTKKLPNFDVNISRKKQGWKLSTLRAAGINL